MRSPNGGAFISQDARQWLKKNLDLDVERYRGVVATSPQHSKTAGGLWDSLKNPSTQKRTVDPNAGNARYITAARARDRDAFSDGQYANSKADHRSRALSAYSDPYAGSKVGSQVNSTMSRLPELAPFQLMNLANEIYSVRQALCQSIKGGATLRDVLSSSKLQSLLLTAGYKVSIGYLKALLKELGFSWNGPACSIQKLLQRLKEYLHPEAVPARNDYETRGGASILPEQDGVLGVKRQEGTHSMVEIIKELFYSTGKTLY